MSILIKGTNIEDLQRAMLMFSGHEIVELQGHGDLIDRDTLNEAMYHEAFETDSEWQKWDSGCCIRYKMFERHRDSAPVVIPADRGC